MNISAFPVARLTDLVDGGLLGLLHLLGVQQRAAADAVEGRLPELRAVLAPLVREPPKFAKFSLQLLKIFGKLCQILKGWFSAVSKPTKKKENSILILPDISVP